MTSISFGAAALPMHSTSSEGMKLTTALAQLQRADRSGPPEQKCETSSRTGRPSILRRISQMIRSSRLRRIATAAGAVELFG
ncbi:hypothetical protein CQ13_09435 [Bradyrhizobium retamae]|uniref:Uncharacterized protein n=1 Tax=Bradyrhizobium retamae TaxID=1300035 RepID=A0A0R3ML66_9BRAD|nr:hypothetical protein CQ13_09435 [Bradyrhizobium retamae]